MNDVFSKWAIGILSALVISAVGMLIDVKIEVSQLRNQDAMNRKFWKLHHWAKDRINTHEVIEGKPLTEWPDLD